MRILVVPSGQKPVGEDTVRKALEARQAEEYVVADVQKQSLQHVVPSVFPRRLLRRIFGSDFAR